MGHMKRLWEKQFEPPEPTPEERAEAAAEAARERAEEAEGRLKQEREWSSKYPREWAEWRRIWPHFDHGDIYFGPEPREPYGFPQFLAEVGKAPSPNHAVERIEESRPFCEGNMHWVECPPARPKEQSLEPPPADTGGIARELRKLRRALRPAEPEIIGTPEVAKLAGVTTAAVRQWVESGAVPRNCIVPGSGNGTPWRFYRRRILKWLRTR